MSSKQDGLNASKVNPSARKQIKGSIRPALEQLETRMVPAKVVTTILDTTNPSSPTTGSLRAAITLPSPADRVIEFNDYLFAASIGTTHNPTALALGDFRGTGKTDVVSASAFINSLTLAPDNGNGVGILNQTATVNTTGLAANITAIETANLNGDTYQDFVTIQSDGVVRAYTGSAGGTFTASGTITLGGTGAGLVVTDLNNDGRTDVAAALTGATGQVVIAYGNGDGTFGAPFSVTPGNGNYVSLGFGDVTGDLDPYPDLVALGSDGKLTTLLGAASNPYTTFKSTTVTGTSSTFSSLTMGDLNGDKRVDAVIVNRNAGTITTMLGSATGAFTAGSVTTLAAGALPGIARLGDFDGDTQVDLAVTQYGLNNVAVYTGKNDGSFNTTATTFDVVAPTDIRVADMTGDGKLDIVASSETSQSFAVFTNSGTGTFNPVAYKQATFILNGAVGSLNDTLTNDIKIFGGNLYGANAFDSAGNSLSGKPRVLIQADVGFDLGDYDLTSIAGAVRGSGFRVNDILSQGTTSTSGGARFQVTGVDAAGGVTTIRVLQPGSQTVYNQYGNGTGSISPPSSLSTTDSNPYKKLIVTSGTGSGLSFPTGSFTRSNRTSGLFFQNTPGRTLTLDGLGLNASFNNSIIVTQGNLSLQNTSFTDIDNVFGTARGNLYFVRLQSGAGSLTVNNSRFDDGRVDAINGGSSGTISITGSTFTNMDGQALTISAGTVTIDSTLFLNNGDRKSGLASNVYYDTNIRGNLNMNAAGSINASNKITVTNSIFDSNNDAVVMSEERSLKLTGGTVSINNSIFRNNVTNGALELSGSQATITNSWFDGNAAPMYFNPNSGAGDQLRGGSALLIRGGTPITLTGDKFTNNIADNINSRFSGGGAIYLSSSTVTIDQCAFEGNVAKITSNYPGSETTDYMNTTAPSIGSPERAPAAKYSGGGALYAGGATIIRDSYFTNNSLLSYVDIWQPTADEATRLSQPQYSGGGAVYLTRNLDSSTSSDIFNTTFVDNFVQQVEANKDITRAGAQRQDQTLGMQALSSATADVTGDGSNDLVSGGTGGLQIYSGGGNQSLGGLYSPVSSNVGQVLTPNLDNAGENEVTYLSSTGTSSTIRSAVNIRPGNPSFDSTGTVTYTDPSASTTETGVVGTASARIVTYQLGGANGVNLKSRIIHTTVTGTITAGATTQSFTVNADGSLTIAASTNANFALSGSLNLTTGLITLVWNSTTPGATSVTATYSQSSITEFAMGDYDGDGFPDMAFGTTDGKVRIMENTYASGNVNGTGFGTNSTFTLTTGTPVSIGMGRFDGAGADVAVLANNGGVYTVNAFVYDPTDPPKQFVASLPNANVTTVFLNPTGQTLTTTPTTKWTKLVTGDFNRNGDNPGVVDIACFNPTDTVNGTKSAGTIAVITNSFSAASGNYSLLGIPTYISGITSSINTAIANQLYATGTTVESLNAFSAGDMNGDSIPDFIISVKLNNATDPTRPTDAIAILTYNGNGGISATNVYLTNPNRGTALDKTLSTTESTFDESDGSTTILRAEPAFIGKALAGTIYLNNQALQNYTISSTGTVTVDQPIVMPYYNNTRVYVTGGTFTTSTGVITFNWSVAPGANHASVRVADHQSITTTAASLSTTLPAFASTIPVAANSNTGFLFIGGTAIQTYTVGDATNGLATVAFRQIPGAPLFYQAASGTLDLATRELTINWNRSLPASTIVKASISNTASATTTLYNSLTNYVGNATVSGTIYAANQAVQTFSTSDTVTETSAVDSGSTASILFRNTVDNPNLTAVYGTLTHPVSDPLSYNVTGSIFVGGVPIQTYTYNGTGFTFNPVTIAGGVYANGGNLDLVTGNLTFTFNQIPGASTYITTNYKTSDLIFNFTKINNTSTYVTDARYNAVTKSLSLTWNTNPGSSRVETIYTKADSIPNTQTISATNTLNTTFVVSGAPIAKGSLSGTIYLGETAIQTFTVNPAGVFTITNIKGTPSIRAIDGAINPDTGVINLFWNQSLLPVNATTPPSVIVKYMRGYNPTSLATGQYNNRADARMDIVSANANQSASIFFGNGAGGLPNLPATGRGLNGGAILIAEGRPVVSPVTQNEGVRSGSLDVRIYNTTIVANSLINSYAANDAGYPISTSVYDPTRGTTVARALGSNFRAVNQTSSSNYANYADVGGMFNDTGTGSQIKLLNTVVVNNTGLNYGIGNFTGTPRISQADMGQRPDIYGPGAFYSQGSILFRPLASEPFLGTAVTGDIIQSDQQVNFDSFELIDTDNFRTSLVGPSVSKVGYIQAQLAEIDTQKIKYLPLSRLSPARDGGDNTVGGVNVVGLLNSSGTDIRGANRTVNNAIDIGAYEVQIASRTDLFDTSILTPGTPNPTVTTPFEYGQPINIDLKSAWNDNVVPTAAVTGTVSLIRVSDDVTLGTADYGTPVNSADISTGKHSIVTINPGSSTYSTLLSIGTTSVYGSYAGDLNYAASQTNPFNIVITKASTAVSIDSTTAIETGSSVTISGKVITPLSVATLVGEGSVKVEYQVPGSSTWLTLTSAAALTLDPTDSSSATFTVSTGLFVGLGQYNLRATFIAGGPNHYTNSTAATSTQDIVKTPTVALEFRNGANTALLSSPATVTHNTAFIIRAIVTAGVVAPTPIGTLDLVKSDGTLLSVGSPTISSGGAGVYFYDFAIAPQTPGLVIPASPDNTLFARYNGYGSVAGDYFKTAPSAAQNLIINGIKATLSLSSTSPSTVLYGTKITIDALLGNNGNPGVVFDTSTIKLIDTTLFTQVATATTPPKATGSDSFTASFPLVPLVGNHSYDATYTGDGFNYDPLTTTNPLGLLNFVVSKAPVSSSTLSAPIYAAQSSLVRLAVDLSNGAAGADASALKPTGTVTFYATSGTNRIALGTTTLVAGAGTFDYTTTAGGQYPISIVYSGDSNYEGTASGTFTPFGTLIVPTIVLNLGGNPANVSRGANISFEATISPAGSALEQPSDVTFNFMKNSVVVASVNVPLNSSNPGLYTLATQLGGSTLNLANGSYTVTATYTQGGGLYPTMVSAARTLNVGLSSSTTTLAATTTTTLYRYGEDVKLDATVTGFSGLDFLAPGSVDIIDGSKALNTTALALTGTSPQTVTLNSANLASALSVGTHNLQAKYTGDSANYLASASTTQSIIIAKADTTATVIASSPVSGIVISGGQLTLNVTIGTPGYVSANALRPTGNVTFVSGGTTLGTATVNASGVASLTINPTALGNFTVVATYGGDGNYKTSSVNTSYTVASLNFAPLASSVIQRGSLLTLTADVSPTVDSRANTPLGYVNFVIPGTSADTLVASVNLSQAVNGRYSTTIDTGNPAFNLPVGTYKIVAKYVPGAGDFYPAVVSGEQSLVVTKQAIILGGSLESTDLVYGSTMSLTNSFIAPGISGSTIAFAANAFVTLFDGQTPIATIPFTDSFRSLILPPVTFNAGVHNLQLRFAGDANYQAGTFDLPTLTVSKAPANIALISSGFNQTAGKAFTLTAQVSTPQLNLPTTPSGTVTFSIDNAVIGQSTIGANGQATFNFTPTAAGAYVIQAAYAGDSNFGPPVSTTTTVVASTLTLSPIVPSITTLGGKITLSAISAPASDNVLFEQNGTVNFVLPNGIVVATATAANSTVTANGRLYSMDIDSGIAQYNLRSGTVTIRAVYVPGINDTYPTLTTTTQSVLLNKQPTETILVSDPLGSAPFGSPISISINTQAIVAAGNADTTIPFGSSGSIALFDGSTLLQQTAVSGSTLNTTFTIPVLNGGTHNLSAVYSGDSVNFLGSKSNVVSLQIAKAATTLSLTPGNGSALVGTPVTLTATLASSVSSTFGLPTGSVQFKLGTTILATVPITGTTAKFSYTPSKSGLGAFTATYLGNTNFSGSTTTASLQFRARDPIFIVASQAGSTFMTYNAKTGKQISIFQPLGPTYTGGFRVAKGDVNGDGYADFAYTTSTGSFVRIIDGRTQSSLGGFYAYTSAYRKPVNLAIGDINGDGRGDIIVAPGGFGYGPNVRAFSGANYSTILFNKNVYSTSFISGVSVASGDVNGDGKSDIICAPMAGAGPNVVVYSGATGALLNSINAIATGNISGFSVTADDLTGDGKAEIIVAAMSGTQQVIVLDGATLRPRNSFLPFGTTFTGGSRVTTVEDINGDGIRDIVVASGPGGNSLVRRFSGQNTRVIDEFFAYATTNAARNKGLFIA